MVVLEDILKEGADRLGIRLDESQISRFLTYLEELKRWNRRINLTALTSDREIITRHFLDSLTPAHLLKEGFHLLDIGSGAGFPGLPLKIALPGLRVTLMEATEKKVFFIKHLLRRLGIKEGIEPICGRAEDGHLVGRYRGSFDVVISRAVTGLEVFLRLSLPYVRRGGMVVSMKGSGFERELRGRVPQEYGEITVEEVGIPFTERKTVLIVCRR